VFFEKYSFNTQPINCSIGAGSWVIGFKCHFQQYFGYIVSVSFIGGGNHSTMRKPLTCCKSLTNFITVLYWVHLTMSRIRTQNFSGDQQSVTFYLYDSDKKTELHF
jgi:hypothetical protein